MLESDEVHERVVRRSAVVNATPQQIFDLLANPSEHTTFDGSGTVRRTVDDSPDRLALGSRFGMKMRMGVPYKMTNEVVEFEEPRLIAWRHLGGHVWRYRLREVDGGTEITEEFDWRPSKTPILLKVMKSADQNARAIEGTLDRFAELFPDNA
jgi:uncharacterized protein YndB with AHSA1/START domain